MKNRNLSIQKIEKFLAANLGVLVSELSPIDQGEWSSAYSYRLGLNEFIIRFSNFDKDFRKDEFASRFESPKLPIPKIIQIGEAFGSYYAISEKAAGVAIDLLNVDEINKVVPSLMKLMDSLRKTDISNTQGFGTWNSDGHGPHKSWKESLLAIITDDPNGRIHGWKENLTLSSVGIDRFNHLFQQFASLVEICPEERYLIHADLLHYNLLIDDNRISAVIDWGCAKYGDFLYELAWFIFWGSWFPSMQGIDFMEIARKFYSGIGVDIPFFDERITAYELHIGLDSIIYCSYIENWQRVEKVIKQMEKIVEVP